MKRGIVIAVMLALVGFGVRAQDDAGAGGWRLKSPTAEEYLTAIVEVASETDRFPSLPYFQFANAASETLFYLYPDLGDIRFNSLFDAYTKMGIGTEDLVDRGEWVRRMVSAWINENAVDLSQTKSLEFEDFYITVIPRDFNADGVDEYLLDIMKGKRVDRQTENCQQAEIIDYLLVQKTNGGYRYIDTNVPWRGQQDWIYSSLNGGIVELQFEDINADDLPEWVVLEGGGFAGGMGMGSADVGELLILGWRNDRLEYLNPTSYSEDRQDGMVTTSFASAPFTCEGTYPMTVDWEFTNIDEDDALEILQAQGYINNWLCERTETKIFDWNPEADRYLYTKTQIEYAEQTQNCAQMRAEEVMWTRDYAAAIPIFEKALALKAADLSKSESFSNVEPLNQYLRARLAFAYLMVGNNRLARPLLDALSKKVIEDKPIESYVMTLKKALSSKASPLSICIATYNIFAQREITGDNIPDIRVGYTGDDLYYFDNPYQPENIGCNAPKLLTETLQTQVLTSDQSPIEFLTKLGIGINHFLQTDLNGDGQSEWLVWPDVAGVEIFFAPDGDHYHVSYPNVDRYQFADELRSWRLPDDAGSGIVLLRTDWHGKSLAPWYAAYDPFGGMGGGPPTCSEGKLAGSMPGEFALWELRGVELTEVFSRGACTTELNEFFPSGEGSPTLQLIFPDCADEYCDSTVMKTDIYIWDTTAKNYVAPLEADATPELTLAPQPTSTPKPFPQYYSVLDAFDHRDFAAVVIMVDKPFKLNSDDSYDDSVGDYYLRALALEALGRDDDALAAYVSIYEAAPESAWGMLARLHLEPLP